MTSRQTGFALLIVLWTLVFLSWLGTQVLAAARSATQLERNLTRAAVFEAAADGAVANVVFQILVARQSRFKADGVVRVVRVGSTPVLVRVDNESDRINLNTASESLLKALILATGAAPSVAVRLAEAIVDWRSSGMMSTSHGTVAPDYRSAGLAYGPPRASFKSVGELLDVMGMTPDLYDLIAPHLTVLTATDPDLSTRDMVVAEALLDAAPDSGNADDTQRNANVMLQQTSQLTAAAQTEGGLGNPEHELNPMLRVSAVAIGRDSERLTLVAVASLDLQDQSDPKIKVLLREKHVGVNAGQGF